MVVRDPEGAAGTRCQVPRVYEIGIGLRGQSRQIGYQVVLHVAVSSGERPRNSAARYQCEKKCSTGYALDSGSRRLWSHVGRPRPRPAPWPASSRRTGASAAVQGNRPTKPMPERLPAKCIPSTPHFRDIIPPSHVSETNLVHTVLSPFSIPCLALLCTATDSSAAVLRRGQGDQPRHQQRHCLAHRVPSAKIEDLTLQVKQTARIRVEIFNLFNQRNPDPATVDTNLNSATFGSIAGGLRGGISTRVIQLAAKL
jgi:hypothetical protein